jgi:spermidine synthase
MAASGAAALGCQIVWTQQNTLWLGHEAAAVLAVVSAFFLGIGGGALWLAPRLHALANPWRAYALCEAAIGAWTLLLSQVHAPLAAMLLSLIGEQPSAVWHWSVAFVGTALMLLPATLAMGATLPAMDRVLRAWQGPERLGALYAANTAGGVVGVLAASLWLVPVLGLPRTGWVCAALNGMVAVLAWGSLSGQRSFASLRMTGGTACHPEPRALDLFADSESRCSPRDPSLRSG